MVEVVVVMEAAVATAAVEGDMEEEGEAMGAAVATEGGAEEAGMAEGAVATVDGAGEGDMVVVAEEETGGTGETVGGALPGTTSTD
jgi:hypothetical protein